MSREMLQPEGFHVSKAVSLASEEDSEIGDVGGRTTHHKTGLLMHRQSCTLLYGMPSTDCFRRHTHY